ncbi:MAG: class I SAM-dependent methyltransferase [Verrucomicrobia bacterium]|nr:class I SAM-dependent methyltransferase [Verrucomicrobiota bacterium]NBU68470.1 class I SAM-dependent methyltransferase [Verrucomicrobiota bacterium]
MNRGRNFPFKAGPEFRHAPPEEKGGFLFGPGRRPRFARECGWLALEAGFGKINGLKRRKIHGPGKKNPTAIPGATVLVREFSARYAGGIPPWQIDRPQPEVLRLIRQGKFQSPVLDLGCGTGDNAIALASSGYRVVAMDPIPEALRRAREKASRLSLDPSPEFRKGNALSLDKSGLKVATVLDSAVFHIFSDGDQERYAREVGSVLASGGRLHLLSFSERETRQPGPRRLTLEQISRPFQAGWVREEAVRCRYEDLVRADGAHAWRITFRKA